MTPFELSLRSEVETERRRFDSAWFFQWHNITSEKRVVDVDRFDGGRIHLGGITFGDQQQTIFWQTLNRYLDQTIHSVFKRWDEETKGYPAALRRASIEGTAGSLRSFVAWIVKQGVTTDQAVRGRGTPETDTPRYAGPTEGQAFAEIQRLCDAHLSLMETSVPKPEAEGWWKSLENWYSRNKALTWAIGIGVAIVGALIKVFV